MIQPGTLILIPEAVGSSAVGWRFARLDVIGLESFSHVTNPHCRELLTVWLDARRDGICLPAKKAMDPLAFWPLLSQLWLMEWDSAISRYRYRLAGEQVADFFERCLRGLSLDDLTPAGVAAKLRTKFDAVRDCRAIIYDSGQIYQWTDKVGYGARIILPLRRGDEPTADFVLGLTVYDHDRRERLNQPEAFEHETVLTEVC